MSKYIFIAGHHYCLNTRLKLNPTKSLAYCELVRIKQLPGFLFSPSKLGLPPHFTSVHTTVYSHQYVVYSVQRTVKRAQGTVYSVMSTVYTTIYSIKCTGNSLQCRVYSVQCQAGLSPSPVFVIVILSSPNPHS